MIAADIRYSPLQELIDEGDQDLLLSRSNIDRAIMARLMMDPSSSLQRPFFYLLDVYARCSRELRTTDSYKDKALAEQLHSVVLQTQELALSHANLVLTMDLFPKASFEKRRSGVKILSEPCLQY